MTSSDRTQNIELIEKLDLISLLKSKTNLLEDLRQCLQVEVESSEQEEKCLDEYKAELELLVQEKMAHVEELRLIHSDINLLETTVRQAKEERIGAAQRARKLFVDFEQTREQVIRLRDALDIETLPGSGGGALARGSAAASDHLAIPRELFSRELSGGLGDSGSSGGDQWPPRLIAELEREQQAATASVANESAYLPPTVPRGSMALVSAAAAAAASSVLIAGSSGASLPVAASGRPHDSAIKAPTNITDMSAAAATNGLRQQPPPMKSCLSCHQQIHRNAPICPLCKAKSRSRNPKKPKRKPDGAI